MLRQLILQLRTVRYLRARQLFYYILRRHLPPRYVSTSATPTVRVCKPGESPCSIGGIYVSDSSFRFLNVEVNIGGKEAAIDWPALSEQRLWRYNLHYFDYLRESARPTYNKDRLIQSWIDENPQGSGPGWEPFTTSRRIVNWIFYMLQRPSEDIPTAWLDSLFLQALWLERNDEKHILANHYFENLKALLFAGCFFDNDDSFRWARRSVNEIQKQVREQTLSDGGHYERSHQYHCLMLENYLDILNLSEMYPRICPSEFVNQVRSCAEHGLEWLAATLFPDGMIPLFNDSAFGVSILPSNIFAYAERLSVNVNPHKSENLELIDRPESGLYGCRIGDDMVIIDCGDIGPRYQPGHTHCDFLSYELMIAKRRIVVDTGVFEYEPGPMRHYVRSTKAHNTVSVDGGEQSEIWGEFRVARRALKIAADIRLKNNVVYFRGVFQGFYDVKNRIRHQRTATITFSTCGQKFQKLTITDRVSGTGRRVVESFIHLHPDISVRNSNNGNICLVEDESDIACIQIPDDQDYRIESAIYCPEFGKKIPNQVIILRAKDDLPVSLGYEIHFNSC